MNQIDPQAIRFWLDSIPVDVDTDELVRQWDEFARESVPVVTVFGSYDTGKSSLIRRLLVDAGVEVPDWLTISGRHETYDVNGIELFGCLVRDTPGLAVGADDARGVLNTRLANAAVQATDVAVITVPPQLATGERGVLVDLLRGDWKPDELWFVIGRFDEAGIDPEDDIDSYRALAARKVAELRESLQIGMEFPVFVVSQDFSQMAGGERNVDPGVWDAFRDWDGIDAVTRAFATVATADFAALRRSTEQRYWRRTIGVVRGRLQAELANAEPKLAQAQQAVERTSQWEAVIDGLDSAARKDLRRALEQPLREALDFSLDPNALAADLKRSLTAWLERHTRELDRYVQDVQKSAARQRSLPSWQSLEALADELATEPTGTDDVKFDAFAPHVSKIGTVLLEALRAFEIADGAMRPDAGANAQQYARQAAKTLGLLIGPIEKIVRLVDEYRLQRAVVKRDRAAFNQVADALRDEASAIAEAGWVDLCDTARALSRSENGREAELLDGLRDFVDRTSAALAGADELLKHGGSTRRDAE